MDEIQQLREAKAFAERWANKGYEKGEGQKFWIDLLQNVLGMSDAVQKCKFEMLASNGGFIDAYIPDCGVLIEQKGLSVDLDKQEVRQGRQVTPFQQAKWYADNMPNSIRPDWSQSPLFKTSRIFSATA